FTFLGNDQLRFHPEESQYYSNQPQQQQQSAPVNNAPSYADLANLAQQEAQQQAIIDAQKKLETNKLMKDIEYIQKQQDMLQQQIHAQEVKNEQKLNAGSSGSFAQGSSGSYGGNSGSFNPQQSTPGTFNSGQWSPDHNAEKYNNGLYNGEGFPSPPLTNPDAPAGGYGPSGGGTPGISFPEYQPNDAERVPCTQKGHTCVAKHLCVNGKVNSNGIGIIQLRFAMVSPHDQHFTYN
ncbi:hypothetical protein WDU94_009968, partial [Cyamophila willieti]